MLISQISWEKIPEVFKKTIHPVFRTDIVPLSDAVGRFTAKNVYAYHAVPPFNRSLVDGYALGNPLTDRWKVTDEKHTGVQPQMVLQSGEAVNVQSGSIIPKGTYAVVKYEDLQFDGTYLHVLISIDKGAEIESEGSDIAVNSLLLQHNIPITPQKIVMLAASGHSTVEVIKKPRVIIIVIQDDMQLQGQELDVGQVYDSTSAALYSIIKAFNANVLEIIRVAEDQAALRATLSIAIARADLIVTTSDAASCKKDSFTSVMQRMGKFHFKGANICPGKAVIYGEINGTPVLNFSSFAASNVTLTQILLPKIMDIFYNYQKQHMDNPKVALREKVDGYHGMTRILPGYIEDGKFVSSYKSNAAVCSFGNAQGYILIPPTVTALQSGTIVDFHFFFRNLLNELH